MSRQTIQFESKSGPLQVSLDGSLLKMNFPAFRMDPCQNLPENLWKGLKSRPQEIFIVEEDPKYYIILSKEEEVSTFVPDLTYLEKLHPFGVVNTAPGNLSDCVSRYFAPSYGIPEDPVTGSIHSALVPYWSIRLKNQ